MTNSAASFRVLPAGSGLQTVAVAGDWTIWTIGPVDEALRKVDLAYDVELDVSELDRIDTSGAYVLDRALRISSGDRSEYKVVGNHPFVRKLLDEVRSLPEESAPESPRASGAMLLLERLGHGAFDAWRELLGTLSFVGETMVTMGRLILNPRRIRWTSVFALIEEVGIDALPIVTFLSFFIGLVIAFIGANLLAMFNASVFTVELVGIGVLREFGVVLTAILLAGRTDSAFTAQIGAMRMRQEIDAMRVIGLDPIETLVAPRLIALLVATPLLTFAATIAGVGGGLFAAWFAMDISPTLFIERFRDVVPPQHFWVGMVKAPVFAIVVALVGCRQGMLVEGNVLSLGRRTTTSVVQSIFMVIALDAVFAILYYVMDV